MKKGNVLCRASIGFAVLLSLVVSAACPLAAQSPQVEWLRQVEGEGNGDEIGNAVYGDRDIYVAGYAEDSISGQQSAGIHDALIIKYDSGGSEIWTRQFGTSLDTYARGVYSDAGGVYIAGNTTGAFPGSLNAGNIDAFVYKLDSGGNHIWTRQFGGESTDYAYTLQGYGDYVYVVGVTYGELPGHVSAGGSDVFLRKFSSNGDEVWTRQFGTFANDYAYSVFAGESGIYVAGITYGQMGQLCGLGGSEAFVRKYDADGKEVWTQQFGSAANDYANAVTADDNGVYVLGITYGSMSGTDNMGGADTFISRLNLAGDLVWTKQLGTNTTDFAWAISAYGGNIYISGYTAGTFYGQVNAGQYDVYGAAFNRDGDMLWLKQLGTEKDDYAKGIYAGANGIFLAGTTRGAFSARQGGGADIFTVKLTTG